MTRPRGRNTKYGKLSEVDTDNIVDKAVTAAKLADDVTTTLVANDKSITVSGGGAILATGAVKQSVLAGAIAGDHALSGISTADELCSVIYIKVATGILTFSDLTSEFTVGSAKINNDNGTNTTNGFLLVNWILRH